MIESINVLTIIYIDHDVSLKIAKQIFLIISLTNTLNLRFVKVFEYVQKFDLIIRHKSNKFHIISDALFKLYNAIYLNENANNSIDEKFDVLFIVLITQMNFDFNKRLLNKYVSDFD